MSGSRSRLNEAARRLAPLLSVLLVLVLPLGGVAADEKGGAFRGRMAAIRGDIGGDLMSVDYLFDSRPFVEMWEAPLAFRAEALALLGDAKADAQDKFIATVAMQHLPLDDFLDYGGAVMALRREGRIDFPIFISALLMNRQLAEQYRQPKVRAVLEALKHSELLASDEKYREHIDHILSGEDLASLDAAPAHAALPWPLR